MPSSKNYEEVKKFCLCCGKSLKLKNNRDTERKRFCSRKCSNTYTWNEKTFEDKNCLVCDVTFTPTNHNQKYCSSVCCESLQVARSYKSLNNNPEKYFQHALYKKGREALTVEFMMHLYESQGGLCAISGKKLTFIKKVGGGRVNTNASIDQIIAGGGYTENNVQLVCDIVNRMKIDMTMKELRFWCYAILEG